MIIDKAAKDLELDTKLQDSFGAKAAGGIEGVRHRKFFTDKQKMGQFMKDGFLDRYTGEKLVTPGLLKVISFYFPDEFPYHAHWKMHSCHNAYWELVPTVDHIMPVALGGADDETNWATTSMLHNSIKSNWSMQDNYIKKWHRLSLLYKDVLGL